MRHIMISALAGAAFVATTLTAADAIELKMNGLHDASHSGSITHEFFADRVAQLTDREITIDVNHSRALGDAVDSVQNIRNGTLAFFTVSAANLSQVDKRMDMFSLPYIFKNADHYWDYLTSERAEEFVQPLEDKGLVVLAFIDSGARSFFGSGQYATPEELGGQKIRTMASPVQIAMVEAMGGTGVPIAWGELYNALQTGVVDGAENNPPSVRSMKFYEVTDTFVLDEHARIPDILIASKKVLDQLSPEQVDAIKEAGNEAEAFMRGAWAADEAASLAYLKSLPDFTVVEVVDKGPFVDSVRELLATESENLGVKDEVDYLLGTQASF